MNSDTRTKLLFRAIRESTLHSLKGNWYNADRGMFYELRAENGFYTTMKFHGETEEIFVVATGVRQGFWRRVA